jgi:hypothetical protein
MYLHLDDTVTTIWLSVYDAKNWRRITHLGSVDGLHVIPVWQSFSDVTAKGHNDIVWGVICLNSEFSQRERGWNTQSCLGSAIYIVQFNLFNQFKMYKLGNQNNSRANKLDLPMLFIYFKYNKQLFEISYLNLRQMVTYLSKICGDSVITWVPENGGVLVTRYLSVRQVAHMVWSWFDTNWTASMATYGVLT